MADSFERYDNDAHGNGFMLGLLAGAVLGVGLGMLLAPKAGNELRGTIGEQARNLGNKASEQYRRASETASGWAVRGREFVDRARDAAERGVEEARSYADEVAGKYGANQSGGYGGGTGTTGPDFGRS